MLIIIIVVILLTINIFDKHDELFILKNEWICLMDDKRDIHNDKYIFQTNISWKLSIYNYLPIFYFKI